MHARDKHQLNKQQQTYTYLQCKVKPIISRNLAVKRTLLTMFTEATQKILSAVNHFVLLKEFSLLPARYEVVSTTCMLVDGAR